MFVYYGFARIDSRHTSNCTAAALPLRGTRNLRAAPAQTSTAESKLRPSQSRSSLAKQRTKLNFKAPSAKSLQRERGGSAKLSEEETEVNPKNMERDDDK